MRVVVGPPTRHAGDRAHVRRPGTGLQQCPHHGMHGPFSKRIHALTARPLPCPACRYVSVHSWPHTVWACGVQPPPQVQEHAAPSMALRTCQHARFERYAPPCMGRWRSRQHEHAHARRWRLHGGASHSPFFCMMMHVTTYLKGLFKAVNRLMQCSKQLEVHWLTCTCQPGGASAHIRLLCSASKTTAYSCMCAPWFRCIAGSVGLHLWTP